MLSIPEPNMPGVKEGADAFNVAVLSSSLLVSWFALLLFNWFKLFMALSSAVVVPNELPKTGAVEEDDEEEETEKGVLVLLPKVGAEEPNVAVVSAFIVGFSGMGSTTLVDTPKTGNSLLLLPGGFKSRTRKGESTRPGTVLPEIAMALFFEIGCSSSSSSGRGRFVVFGFSTSILPEKEEEEEEEGKEEEEEEEGEEEEGTNGVEKV